MQIRRAGFSDAEDVASVLRSAFQEFEPLYTPEGFRATTVPAEEVARHLADAPAWIAEIDGVVVGTVSGIDRHDEVRVRSMAVCPAARGYGVGSGLLSAVEDYALAHRARRLTLTTTPFLCAAIRLYGRAGFERTDDVLDLHGTPLFAMVKQLPGAQRGQSQPNVPPVNNP